ncbi:hypothetical protein [Bdellovibrio sp. HCB274]|uniref:hypothetical protein n=1 Tax=Bdellovibrio sp. HCB274 TaxID=3394361 RepID=UPI0039B6CC63
MMNKFGGYFKFILSSVLLASPMALAKQWTPEELAKEIAIYQKGDQWSVGDITEEYLKNPIIKKAYSANVHVGAASGIYLGKFKGKHIVATNSHVADGPKECKNFPPKVMFDSNIWSDTVGCIGAWPEIDLALLVVKPYDVNAWEEGAESLGPEAYELGEKAVAGRGVNLAFNTIPEFEAPLLNIGFGIAGDASPDRGNPLKISVPRITFDDDCRVLSQTGEVRLLFDPDTINPLGYAAWSFANGCDTSHGSSGSLLMNRETGEILGVEWTGTWTKAGEEPISSQEIAEISRGNSPEVWSRLNYAVPAFKIKEFLLKQVRSKKIVGPNAALIKAIVEK